MVQIKTAPRKSIVIAPGVEISALNPDWHRPFEVVERVKFHPGDANPPRECFLCRFTERPEKEYPPNEFMWFGVVKTGKFVEPWPIITKRDEEGVRERYGGDALANEGEQRMRQYLCSECGRFVRFSQRRRVMGPEAILITYTCPHCGAKDEDLLD